MKDQHTKIKGYRDLSQEDIDLMNRIKTHGEVTGKLLEDLYDLRFCQGSALVTGGSTDLTEEKLSESFAALENAKQYLQTGQMWFVRAVALPDSF